MKANPQALELIQQIDVTAERLVVISSNKGADAIRLHHLNMDMGEAIMMACLFLTNAFEATQNDGHTVTFDEFTQDVAKTLKHFHGKVTHEEATAPRTMYHS